MERLLSVLPDDFLTWQIKKFKILGLWPIEGQFRKLHLAFFGLNYFFVVVIFVCSELFQNYMERENFTQTLLNVAISSLHVNSLIRITHWYLMVKNGTAEAIIDLLRRTTFDFKDFNTVPMGYGEVVALGKSLNVNGYANIRNFWKKCTEQKIYVQNGDVNNEVERFRKETMSKARFWSFLFEIFICVGAFTIMVISYVGFLIIEPQPTFNKYQKKIVPTKELPFHSYYPFDLSVTKNYFVAWTHQFYSIFMVVMQFLAVDVIVLSTIIHVTHQVRCLKNAVLSINQNERTKSNYEPREKIAEIKLIKCVNETQQLLKLVELLEFFANKIYLLQYFVVVSMLCTAVTAIPLIKGQLQIEASFSILILLTLSESFFTSWCCQLMKDEFADLSLAFYCVKWMDYDRSFAKKVIFIMARMQRPVGLSVGKFTIINMEIFVKIMKLTYSFYALLQNHEKK